MPLLQKLRSVRFVLTFWYTAVLLMAFSIFGGSVYVYMQHLLEQTLEQDLAAEVDWIAQLIRLEQERQVGVSAAALSPEVQESITEHFNRDPRNYIVLLATLDGRKVYELENRGHRDILQVPSDRATTTFVSLEREPLGHLRVAALAKEPWKIVVAFPERHIREVLDHTLSIFALLVPVVLLVSFSGGWLLVGLVLRPVGLITQRAERISSHNLSERIPTREVDDEIGRLITTFNYMIARLEASFDQMKQFSLNVAHELKTPLTILRGESELALGRSLTPVETEQLLVMYLEETGRMAHIVDDLLTLAKADAGQVVLRREPVALDKVVQDVFEDALILTAQKSIAVELLRNEHTTVTGDEGRLLQLFRNLVSNAVQYTGEGGSIRISSVVDAGAAMITVQDNGIGIPPESIDRIFDRFYRVDQARSRAKGGSGLGLSLAKWIAESHEGSITVQSEPGKGSSFVVRLPLAARS